jgi:hypothetical protein
MFNAFTLSLKTALIGIQVIHFFKCFSATFLSGRCAVSLNNSGCDCQCSNNNRDLNRIPHVGRALVSSEPFHLSGSACQLQLQIKVHVINTLCSHVNACQWVVSASFCSYDIEFRGEWHLLFTNGDNLNGTLYQNEIIPSFPFTGLRKSYVARPFELRHYLVIGNESLIYRYLIYPISRAKAKYYIRNSRLLRSRLKRRLETTTVLRETNVASESKTTQSLSFFACLTS